MGRVSDDRGVDTTDTDEDRAVATPSSGEAGDVETDEVGGGPDHAADDGEATETTETTAPSGA